MHRIVCLSVAALLAASCAAEQKKVVQVVKEKPKLAAAVTVEDVQKAFDSAVAAMAAQPPDLKAARDGFETALKASPTFPEAHFDLALVLARLGALLEAEREFKTALDQFGEPQRRNVRMELGKFYLKHGRLKEAEAVFQQVLVVDPDDPVIKQNLAVLYRQQKDFETSLKFVREILAREAKNLAALNTLGLLYMDQNNLSMAEWILGKAEKFSKDRPHADVLNSRGLLWLRKGSTPAAVQYFQRAVAASPGHLEARKNLGALYVAFLNYAGGVDQYQAALAVAPRDVEARMGLAAGLFGLGQHEKAAEEYLGIVEQEPRNGAAYQRLGRLYQEFIRDQGKALKYYKEYIRVANPPADDPIVQQIGFLEESVRRGVAKEPEPPKEPERPKAPTGMQDTTGLGDVSVEEALQADPNAPPEEGEGGEGAPPAPGGEGAPPAEGGGAAPPAPPPAPAAPPAEKKPAEGGP